MFSLLPIKLFAGCKVLTRTARMFLEQVFKNWLVSFRVETHWRWSIRIFWIFSLYNKNGSSFEKLISSCVFLTLLCTYFEAYFKLQLSPLPFRFEAVFPPCEVLRLEDLCSCPWEFWQGLLPWNKREICWDASQTLKAWLAPPLPDWDSNDGCSFIITHISEKGGFVFCNCDLPLQRWVLSIFYLEIWGYIYGFKMIVVYSSIENIFSMFFYLNCSLLYGNSLAFLKSFFHLRKSELIVTLMSFKTEDLIHSTSVDTVHSTSCLALRNSQNICENNCRLFSTLPMYRHGVLFLHRFNVLFGD